MSSKPTPFLKLPPVIGDRFEQRRKLGAGGMGAVVLARDRDLDRLVAVKLVPFRGTPALARRFEREARLLASLEHPNVLRLYEHHVLEDVGVLVTEFVEGAPLGEAPLARPLREVMLDVARGVQALHDAEVLHRDIKLANILVTPAGRPVLIDFGIALQDQPDQTRLTSTGAVVGTMAYMAPELVRGALYSTRSDWFAWGVAFYAARFGEAPFGQDAFASLFRGEGLPPLPPARRAELGDDLGLVEACLASDPDARPGNLAELLALAGADPSTREETAPPLAAPTPSGTSLASVAPAARPPPRRSPAVLVGAVALPLVLLGLAALRGGDPAVEEVADGAAPDRAALRELVAALRESDPVREALGLMGSDLTPTARARWEAGQRAFLETCRARQATRLLTAWTRHPMDRDAAGALGELRRIDYLLSTRTGDLPTYAWDGRETLARALHRFLRVAPTPGIPPLPSRDRDADEARIVASLSEGGRVWKPLRSFPDLLVLDGGVPKLDPRTGGVIHDARIRSVNYDDLPFEREMESRASLISEMSGVWTHYAEEAPAWVTLTLDPPALGAPLVLFLQGQAWHQRLLSLELRGEDGDLPLFLVPPEVAQRASKQDVPRTHFVVAIHPAVLPELPYQVKVRSYGLQMITTVKRWVGLEIVYQQLSPPWLPEGLDW